MTYRDRGWKIWPISLRNKQKWNHKKMPLCMDNTLLMLKPLSAHDTAPPSWAALGQRLEPSIMCLDPVRMSQWCEPSRTSSSHLGSQERANVVQYKGQHSNSKKKIIQPLQASLDTGNTAMKSTRILQKLQVGWVIDRYKVWLKKKKGECLKKSLQWKTHHH